MLSSLNDAQNTGSGESLASGQKHGGDWPLLSTHEYLLICWHLTLFLVIIWIGIFDGKVHVVLPVHVYSEEGPEDLAVLHQQVAEPGECLHTEHSRHHIL